MIVVHDFLSNLHDYEAISVGACTYDILHTTIMQPPVTTFEKAIKTLKPSPSIVRFCYFAIPRDFDIQ